jgi:hypothetical protein
MQPKELISMTPLLSCAQSVPLPISNEPLFPSILCIVPVNFSNASIVIYADPYLLATVITNISSFSFAVIHATSQFAS